MTIRTEAPAQNRAAFLAMKAALGLGPPSLDYATSTAPFYMPHNGNSCRYPAYSMTSLASMYADGIRVFDIDTQLTSDGAVAACHDATVDAMTTSTGNVSSFTTAQFKALTIDAGSWFNTNGGNLSPMTLNDALSFYGPKGVFFAPELKAVNGAQVTAALKASGIPTDQALVQSADLTRLATAVAAGYPALKIYASGDTPSTLKAAGVYNIAISSTEADAVFAPFLADPAIRVGVYSATTRYDRARYTAMGCSIIYTDDVLYTMASAPLASSDTFLDGNWMAGMLASQGANDLTAANRGRVLASGYFGWDTLAANFRSVLMGFLGPIKGGDQAANWTLDSFIKFSAVSDDTKFCGWFISGAGMEDRPFTSTALDTSLNGWLVYVKRSGALGINQWVNGVSTNLTEVSGSLIALDTDTRIRVNFVAGASPTLQLQRLNDAGSSITTPTSAVAINTGLVAGNHYPSFCKSSVAATVRTILIT